MSKSIADLNREAASKHVFSDFSVGDTVKVVTLCQDFRFFYGETGEVIRLTDKYLGIIVAVNGGSRGVFEFNFNPADLMIILKAKAPEPAPEPKPEMTKEQAAVALEGAYGNMVAEILKYKALGDDKVVNALMYYAKAHELAIEALRGE